MKRVQVEDLMYRIIAQQYNISEDEICYGELPTRKRQLSFSISGNLNLKNLNIVSVSLVKKLKSVVDSKVRDFEFQNYNKPAWINKMLSPEIVENETVTFFLETINFGEDVKWKCIKDFDFCKELKKAVADFYDTKIDSMHLLDSNAPRFNEKLILLKENIGINEFLLYVNSVDYKKDKKSDIISADLSIESEKIDNICVTISHNESTGQNYHSISPIKVEETSQESGQIK